MRIGPPPDRTRQVHALRRLNPNFSCFPCCNPRNIQCIWPPPQTVLPYGPGAMLKASKHPALPRQAGLQVDLGNRLTVDPRTLTPLVLVRIQVPQPAIFQVIDIVEIIGLKNSYSQLIRPSDAQYRSPELAPKSAVRQKENGQWLVDTTFKISCGAETSGTGALAFQWLFLNQTLTGSCH